MSAMRSAFLVVLLAGSAAGCASTHDSSASTYVSPRASSSVLAQQDGEYIARINQQALTRGIHVEWVNPPLKHAAKPPR
ncbi:hypothetical protein [Cognatilysobacter terrigena]|uniref:hypothetical protein n=1 Tax=Cognatilysobacter terrigena TaxID=2488749 RepID=UPI00105B5E82|nr:hypothetical protein [Lysobacter terrigena]